jgi:hypothetical protein
MIDWFWYGFGILTGGVVTLLVVLFWPGGDDDGL